MLKSENQWENAHFTSDRDPTGLNHPVNGQRPKNPRWRRSSTSKMESDTRMPICAADVAGTGPGGRITKQDVLAHQARLGPARADLGQPQRAAGQDRER